MCFPVFVCVYRCLCVVVLVMVERCVCGGGQNSRVSQQSGGFAERKQMSVQLSPFFSQGWGH